MNCKVVSKVVIVSPEITVWVSSVLIRRMVVHVTITIMMMILSFLKQARRQVLQAVLQVLVFTTLYR